MDQLDQRPAPRARPPCGTRRRASVVGGRRRWPRRPRAWSGCASPTPAPSPRARTGGSSRCSSSASRSAVAGAALARRAAAAGCSARRSSSSASPRRLTAVSTQYAGYRDGRPDGAVVAVARRRRRWSLPLDGRRARRRRAVAAAARPCAHRRRRPRRRHRASSSRSPPSAVGASTGPTGSARVGDAGSWPSSATAGTSAPARGVVAVAPRGADDPLPAWILAGAVAAWLGRRAGERRRSASGRCAGKDVVTAVFVLATVPLLVGGAVVDAIRDRRVAVPRRVAPRASSGSCWRAASSASTRSSSPGSGGSSAAAARRGCSSPRPVPIALALEPARRPRPPARRPPRVRRPRRPARRRPARRRPPRRRRRRRPLLPALVDEPARRAAPRRRRHRPARRRRLAARRPRSGPADARTGASCRSRHRGEVVGRLVVGWGDGPSLRDRDERDPRPARRAAEPRRRLGAPGRGPAPLERGHRVGARGGASAAAARPPRRARTVADRRVARAAHRAPPARARRRRPGRGRDPARPARARRRRGRHRRRRAQAHRARPAPDRARPARPASTRSPSSPAASTTPLDITWRCRPSRSSCRPRSRWRRTASSPRPSPTSCATPRRRAAG